MVWIDFDFDGLDFVDFFETEGEEVLDFFFDFGVLEVEGLFAVVFFGFGLRAEANDGWMVVMGVALTMGDEAIGVSVDFVGEVVIVD
jgi:hypothetical protein